MAMRTLISVLSLAALAACGSTGGPSAPAAGAGITSGAAATGGWPYPTLGRKPPIVIGHRGAPGALPEHTLESYLRAINDGADCIEPDLVFTKDNVLVARHDTYLSGTTDVASKPEFASRKRKTTDPEYAGREDWWVEDFTLAELKTLRARQPMPQRSKAFDGLYQIATFDEVLQLAKGRRTVTGAPVCVYPEAKSAVYFASIGKTGFAEELLAALTRHGMAGKGSPVFIQTFEPEFAKKIKPMTELPVVMLISDKAGLDKAMAVPGAPFWDAIGANLSALVGPDGKSTGLVEAAHARGVAVHSWTFRDDVPVNGESIDVTMRKYLSLGLDGFFTDFPVTGYRVRNEITHGVR